MLEYEPGEIPASYDTWIELLHPDDKKSLIGTVAAYADNKRDAHEIEYRLRTKSGEYCWILSRGKIVGWDGSGRPQRIVGTHVDITERKQIEKEKDKLLKEKEILMQELLHRVKNFFTTAISTINLQISKASSDEVKEILKTTASRLKTYESINQQLYATKNYIQIDMNQFINRLLKTLVIPYNIKQEVKIENVILNTKLGFTCVLIINELINNTVKYAFPKNKNGMINISITKEKANKLRLIVKDNGAGLPESINIEESNTLGLMLVQMLTEQLDGKLTINSQKDKGTEFRILFKVNA